MTARPRLVHIVTVPMSFWLVRGQAAIAQRAGFEVHAVSSPGPEAEVYSRDEQLPHHAVPMARRIAPWQDFVALVRVMLLLRRLKPSVVQAGTPKAGLLGMLAAFLLRVPVRIYHMHGLPLVTATGIRRCVLQLTEWMACGAATRVLCVSHSVRDELVRAGLCPVRKAIVLGHGSCNGVDSDWFDRTRLAPGTRADVRTTFGIPQDALVVGFIGRLTREKGISELHQAWRRVRLECPAAYLLVVGPSEADDSVTAAALRELAQDPRVRMIGPDWNTAPLYAAMDVCCLPTYREGLPNVLLEAAAMELPIVAFRVPGVVDVVEDGRHGRLVDPFSVEALANALVGYVNDPALRSRHGAEGRRRVLHSFRRTKVWAELAAFYSTAALCAGAPAQNVAAASWHVSLASETDV